MHVTFKMGCLAISNALPHSGLQRQFRSKSVQLSVTLSVGTPPISLRGAYRRVLGLIYHGLFKRERESSLLTTHWTGTTSSCLRCFWWTGLAPWEFEFPFPGSLISTFLGIIQNCCEVRCGLAGRCRPDLLLLLYYSRPRVE